MPDPQPPQSDADPQPNIDPQPGEDPKRAEELAQRRAAYWRSNLRCLGLLLLVWFGASFGCGILFVEELNRFHLPGTGFKLGFWFAQQGSIYVFVLLTFVYAAWMNHIDRRFGVEED